MGKALPLASDYLTQGHNHVDYFAIEFTGIHRNYHPGVVFQPCRVSSFIVCPPSFVYRRWCTGYRR